MYLHIGKDEMIRQEDVICLLDYEGLQGNICFQKLFKNIPKEQKIDISFGHPKAVILTQEREKIKAYISNISTNTLANRSSM